VRNARELALLTETLKQKVQAKAQRIRRYEKGKSSIITIRSLKKVLNFFRELGHEEHAA
jgi:ribosome-binding protein aMBF1 (putative translation factor)